MDEQKKSESSWEEAEQLGPYQLQEHTPRGSEDGGQPALAHPFPRKPFKGQKRPPCTPRSEVEINGGCWVPHEPKAPCPEDLFEYQGKCYTTAMLAPPMPRSFEP